MRGAVVFLHAVGRDVDRGPFAVGGKRWFAEPFDLPDVLDGDGAFGGFIAGARGADAEKNRGEQEQVYAHRMKVHVSPLFSEDPGRREWIYSVRCVRQPVLWTKFRREVWTGHLDICIIHLD